MEIISYVKDSKKRKFPVLFGGKTVISSRKKQNVSYAYIPPSEKHVFRAGTVRREFTVKSVLAALGQAIVNIEDFIKTNIKAILISIIAVAGVFALAGGIYFVADYYSSHTSAIMMNPDDSLNLDSLDKLMVTFALEDTSGFDENGVLLDESVKALSEKDLSQPVEYKTYTVKSGDTISGIAKKFGLTNISTLISINDIGNVRQLGAGQKLKIPSMDGIIYTVKNGDSLNSIATANKVRMETILDVNELSSEVLSVGQQLFLPGVGLDQQTLQSRLGELFIIPIKESFRWSSPYGWRADPFTGVQSFHTGTDLACPTGTPILAAMSGKISDVGNNRVYGNYIIINHGNGYQTLYAHMSKTIAKKGQWVSQGTKIGLVGSTGYSTGPHLHFMVYKNGNRIDPMTVLKK